MTTSEPAEQLQSEFSSIQNSLRSLQSKVHMSDARDALADFDTKVKTLPQTIKALRDRKYAFEASLDGKAEDLIKRWNAIRPGVELFIQQQAAMLETAIQPIEARVSYFSSQMGSPEFALGLSKQIQTEISTLEDKINGSVSTASEMYSEILSQHTGLAKHLDDLKYSLDQFELASFSLLPTESVVMAIRATWTRDGKEDRDDPQGILFLTDQRLFFEQRQEVATKKFLFITTETRVVQALMLEVPVAMISDVKGSKQGLFKNEDFLDLTMATGAQVKSAQFHIFGQDFQSWVSLIKRACTHDFDKDRVIQVDQVEVEKIKNAPTICTNCGGKLPTVILRGQETLVCEYCGNVVRL